MPFKKIRRLRVNVNLTHPWRLEKVDKKIEVFKKVTIVSD